MTVNNILETNSLKGVCALSLRKKDIHNLLDVEKYITEINEFMQNSEDIYGLVLDNGELLGNWLFSEDDLSPEEYDLKASVLEILTKNIDYSDECSDKIINISFGELDGCVSDKCGYVAVRRSHLNSAKNVSEYFEFMWTCFKDCVFAEDVLNEMKNIKDFSLCKETITQNLAVLNDEALDLYKSNKNDLNKAVRELTAKLLECSLDPNHRKKLVFRFKYEDEDKREREKYITCEPHLKLIRKDSNLRIYFNWCDEDVAKGEKVLIGRIGSHPY